MAIELNHTIVHSRDRTESARFWVDMLGLDPPEPFGPFLVVKVANGVSFDFMDAGGDVAQQHYAFLISEDDFDQIYARILERSLDHWDGPDGRRRGINHHDGGRGVYFFDPSGHALEVITRPYGSGGG